MKQTLVLAMAAMLLLVFVAQVSAECEVCLSVLDKVMKSIPSDQKKTYDTVEKATRAFCKKAIEKENRLCYYIGATEDAASSLMKDVVTPLSEGAPTQLVCQRLKKKDDQICALKLDKKIEVTYTSEFLSGLRIRELKTVLADVGGECNGCNEKTDFINAILRHAPKKEL